MTPTESGNTAPASLSRDAITRILALAEKHIERLESNPDALVGVNPIELRDLCDAAIHPEPAPAIAEQSCPRSREERLAQVSDAFDGELPPIGHLLKSIATFNTLDFEISGRPARDVIADCIGWWEYDFMLFLERLSSPTPLDPDDALSAPLPDGRP